MSGFVVSLSYVSTTRISDNRLEQFYKSINPSPGSICPPTRDPLFHRAAYFSLSSFSLLLSIYPSYTTQTKVKMAAATPASSFFRITLHRSQIGMPQRTRDVLSALGLHKRGKTVYHPVHPQFAGMIMKVKELVKVDEVAYRPTPKEIRNARRPDPGFWVERKTVR